jgi:transposase InsO family protein
VLQPTTLRVIVHFAVPSVGVVPSAVAVIVQEAAAPESSSCCCGDVTPAWSGPSQALSATSCVVTVWSGRNDDGRAARRMRSGSRITQRRMRFGVRISKATFRSEPSAVIRHDHGWILPVPAPMSRARPAAASAGAHGVRVSVSRVWLAASDSYGRRRPVLDLGGRRSVAARSMVDSPRHPARAHSARPARPEWASRTNAPHAESGDRPPPRTSWRAQQRCFQVFRQEYNRDRPREALGYHTPASQYTLSLRAFPRQLPSRSTPHIFASSARIRMG